MNLKTVYCIVDSPEIRSSYFMRYNFWSKLYSYMKFLQDVYCSIEYIYSSLITAL